jgi:hypothetical protein
MPFVEILKKIFEQSIQIGALASVMLAIFVFLDWRLKDQLKSKFLNSIYGRTSKRGIWSAELPTYYAAIHSLFGLSGFRSFLLRSALATAVMLISLTSLQALVNEDGFTDATLPFFESVVRFEGRSITLIIGVLIIDFLSIYQTATFLRISRGCQNIFDVLFLSLADVLVSILLFIIIFPFFITASFFINAPQTGAFSILISSTLTKQNAGLSDLRSLLLFDPRSKGEMTEESLANLRDRKWQFRSYDISTYSNDGKITLQGAIRSANNAGSIVVQTRGNLEDEKVMQILIEMLRERPYVKSASISESTQGLFSAYALARLAVLNRVTFDFFWKTYGTLVGQINFLDADLLRVLTLHSPGLTANDVAFQYNRLSLLPRIVRGNLEEYIYCDGDYNSVSRSKPYDPEKDYDNCAEAVAVDSVAFANIRSVSLYEDSSESIPISPLALSSLTATAMIYYLLIARIVFRLVRPLFVATIKDGDIFLRRHLFTITFIVLLAVGSPVVTILWLVLR